MLVVRLADVSKISLSLSVSLSPSLSLSLNLVLTRAMIRPLFGTLSRAAQSCATPAAVHVECRAHYLNFQEGKRRAAQPVAPY